jgi:hypothetical protein
MVHSHNRIYLELNSVKLLYINNMVANWMKQNHGLILCRLKEYGKKKHYVILFSYFNYYQNKAKYCNRFNISILLYFSFFFLQAKIGNYMLQL